MKVRSNTKGMGPLSCLMGQHSWVASGNSKKGYGHTRKAAVDNYNKNNSRNK